MAAHLILTVRFFSERYHGKEWPPAPARLFQALVAGAKTGAPARDWSETQERALQWLEGLGAPEILSRPGSQGGRYTIFVPNNNALKDGRSSKTSKQVAPTIIQDHSPGDPDVVYRWQTPDEEARAHLPALDQLAERLRAVGWGIDFAAAVASLEDGGPLPPALQCYAPGARGGLSLRIPSPGLLEHLAERHQTFTRRISTRGVDPYTRPTQFREARYSRAHFWQRRRWIAFELQTLEGKPFAARWDQAQTVAAWLRHAAGETALREELALAWVNSYVLGHTGPDELGHRLSFVPLPSIGHLHSDGGIRRVLVVEPPDATGGDAEALDLLGVTLASRELTGRAILVPLADHSNVLPFYVRASRLWQTVTPVVLHGHNAARGRISLIKTDRLLRQAFDSAGFAEPLLREITFQAAPYWPGCEAAAAIRVPHHLDGWPRLHVRVEFREPVEGPVLAGIGRHCGIGVFATPQED